MEESFAYLWYFLSEASYPLVNEVDSSSALLACELVNDTCVNLSPLRSQNQMVNQISSHSGYSQLRVGSLSLYRWRTG